MLVGSSGSFCNLLSVRPAVIQLWGGGNFSLSSVFSSSSQLRLPSFMQVCEVNSTSVFQEALKMFSVLIFTMHGLQTIKRGWMNFRLNFLDSNELQRNFKHTNSPNRVSQPSGLSAFQCDLSLWELVWDSDHTHK